MITIVRFVLNALVVSIEEKNDTNIRRQLSIISQTSKQFLGAIVYSVVYVLSITYCLFWRLHP